VAKEKEAVEIEPDDREDKEAKGQQTLHTPYGVQDMNLAVEPEPYADGIDEDVERVLTDDVHVDMGRGALTFKPGDTITIRGGHIRKAVTRDGMEYEFRPAHEVAKERFEEDQQAMGENLAAGQAQDDQTAPSQPQDPVDEEMPVAHPEGDEAGFTEAPAIGSDLKQADVKRPEGTTVQADPGPLRQEPEEQPREKGKFVKKDKDKKDDDDA
jgi:hypothetical protein